MRVQRMMLILTFVGLVNTPFRLFAAPPSPETAESQQLILDEAPQAQVKPVAFEEPSRVLAGTIQAAAGLVGGLATGYLGAVIGGGMCSDQEWGCLLEGAVVGYGVGSTFIVWAVGEWMDWDGSLLATIGGAAAVAIVTGIAVQYVPVTIDGQFALAGMALMPVAAAAGYQLSANWPTNTGVLAMPKVTSVPIVKFDF